LKINNIIIKLQHLINMKTISIMFLLSLAVVVSARTASRELLDAQDDINRAFGDAKDEIDGFFASFWGQRCVTDDGCMKYVAYCDKDAGITAGITGIGVDGECRPNIWVWLVLAGIALLLVGSCVCCLLCGLCKCLYRCLLHVRPQNFTGAR